MATRGAGIRWVVWSLGFLGVLWIVLGALSSSAFATSYTDTFETNPFGDTTWGSSFSTAQLSYEFLSNGDGGDFAWSSSGGEGDSGRIDALSTVQDTGTTEKFTLADVDGKSFVFHSIYVDIVAAGAPTYGQTMTITGKGPEPFTLVVPPGSIATYSPSGGAKLVTSVEFSSPSFEYDIIDNVSVTYDTAGAGIYGNGTLIANGDSTPSSGDDTNMGTTPIGTPVDKTFTIQSIGDAGLDLTGSPYVQFSSNPSGDFSIQAQPTTDPIASGGSDTFTVRFNPSSEGVKQATVTIGNDSEADPYTFTVQGEGSGAPEIDVQRPASTSIADGGTDAQGSRSMGTQVTLTYTVENTGNVQLSVTDIASASPSGVTVDDISPTSFTVASGGGTETFTVKYTPTALGAFSFELDVANNDGDEGNYDITVSGTGIDTDPPDVSDITLADADPTNAGSVDFTVTFDESVTGVDTTDFVVDASGLTGASVDAVAGGGTTWTVSVDTGTGDGTLSIDLTDDDTIEDGSGNKLGGTGAGNGSFTTGASYTVDKTPPSVPDGLLPANGAYVNTGTPTLSWNASTDTGGSGLRTTNTYRYQVSGPSSKDDYTANTHYTPTLTDGVYTWRIYARDNAGNHSDWSEENTLTVDTDKPDVTIDEAGSQADPTNSSPVTFTVVFDEPIEPATFTNADVSVGGTATTGTVTVNEIVPNDGTTFEVSIGVTGDGTVQPTIPAGGVEDPAGNTNNASTSTDNSVTYDTDPPGVTSFERQNPPISPTNANELVFRVTFDEDVRDVDVADFDVNSTSTSFVDMTTQVTPNNVYDVTVRGGDLADFNGTVNLDLAPGVAITDYAGNALPATPEPGVDETYTVDNAGPNVTIDQAGGQADPTNASPVTFTAAFDEPIDDATFTNADVSVGGTATTGAVTITEIAPNDDTTFEVSIVVTGDGTVEPTIPGGGVEDPLGNTNSASTSIDNSVTYDGTKPNVTIDQAGGQGDPTRASPVAFEVEFDEPIDDATFTNADVSVGGTATTGAVTITETAPNDGTTFEAEIVVTGDGTVEPTIPAGGVEDPAGNTNKASTSTDNSVTVDTDPPEATGITESPSVVADADVGDQTFTLTIDFDEPMNTGVVPTVSFPTVLEDPSSTIALDPASGWTSNTTYVARYDVVDADEEIGDVDVRVTGARDVAGNAQAQYDEADVFSIDTENPWISSITSTTANGYYDVGAAIDITMNFSESVTVTGPAPQVKVDLDSGASDVPLAVPSGAASTNGTYTVGAGENSCDLNVVGITVNGSMRDAAGNDLDATKTAATLSTNNLANNKDITVDTTDPTITWVQGFPSGAQSMDADCTLEFPIEVRVTDNCCIDAGDVSFALAWPAGVSATQTLVKTQVTGSRVDVTGTVTVSNLTSCPATVDLDFDADDCTGNAATTSSDSVTVDDTSAPTYSWITGFPDAAQPMDEDCAVEFPIEILLEDNCCLDAADVTVTVSDPPDVTVAEALAVTQEGSRAVRIEGSVTLSALTDDSSTVTMDVAATDCHGNGSSTGDAVTVVDEGSPTVSGFAVTPDDGLVDGNCEEVVAVSAVVRDGCCLDAGNVVVTPSATNASLKENHITVTQTAPNEVTVAGTIVVHSLTDCPATVEVEIDATDCSANHSEWVAVAEVEDATVPKIELRVDGHVVLDACCEAIVTFDGYVEDNCCVHPGGIAIEATHPTSNAIVTFDPATDVTYAQNGQGRVDFAGEIQVECLTSCPAIVQVTVNAADCCGNDAAEVASTADPADPNEIGHVVDETAPIPRDDPRQDVVMDESAAIDPIVEVRWDGVGVYRLVLREDTPVRIDVLTNDADNCSCADPDHPFGPCTAIGGCPGCCGAMVVHEIVDPPTHGAATIETACGDCGGGSVIRYAPYRGAVGPDRFTYRVRDACGNVSSVIATVYLQTVPEVAMEDIAVGACSGEPTAFAVSATDLWLDSDRDDIPFAFSIVGGPSHGVLAGDPAAITVTPPGTAIVGGRVVPTLDTTERASITLTYTSAVGYTGRDAIWVRFEDPYGNATTARVDISVTECTGGEPGIPALEVEHGELLKVILPEAFGSIADTAWGSVLLIALEDGTEHPTALSVAFEEGIDRYVITVDTAAVPLGKYLLSVPLGNGETVELTIEVRAPDS